MKTVKDLLDENSPLVAKFKCPFVYKIGSQFSYHITTAIKEGPENFSLHPYFPKREIQYFKKTRDRVKWQYPVVDGRVMISRRGISVDQALDRPELYIPCYSKIMEESTFNYKK